jgi:uncharacterized protein YjcR
MMIKKTKTIQEELKDLWMGGDKAIDISEKTGVSISNINNLLGINKR